MNDNGGIFITQGIGLDDFLDKVRQASYEGYKQAIQENQYSNGIEWAKLPNALSIKQVAEIFGKKHDTVRLWVVDGKFDGGVIKASKYARPLIEKTKVKEVYENQKKRYK